MDSILDELNTNDPILKFVIMLNERVGKLEEEIVKMSKLIIGTCLTTKFSFTKNNFGPLSSSEFCHIPESNYMKLILLQYFDIKNVEIKEDHLKLYFRNNIILHETAPKLEKIFNRFFPQLVVDKWGLASK